MFGYQAHQDDVTPGLAQAVTTFVSSLLDEAGGQGSSSALDPAATARLQSSMTALAGAAIAEPRDDLPCVCEGLPADFDGVYVCCEACGRWVHACCAGFATQEEAEAAVGYKCLICACREGERAPKKVGATLLVCPAAILSQWRDEAEKHTQQGALRVHTYKGVRDAIHQGWKNLLETAFSRLSSTQTGPSPSYPRSRRCISRSARRFR